MNALRTPPPTGAASTPLAAAGPAGRVVFVIFSLSGGGAERVVCLLSRHWAVAGYEVAVVTIDSRDADAYPLDPRVRRVELALAKDSENLLVGAVQTWRRVRALRRAFRELRPDAVVSMMPQTNVLSLLACLPMGVPVVACERTEPHLSHLDLAWVILRRALYPMAAALVVQTRALAGWGRGLCRRLHVIPNFVERPARTAAALDAPGPKRLYAVGRLVPAKGFDLLVDAFARVAHSRPDWTLIVLGEGPERLHLEAQVRRLGLEHRVRLPGRVAEPVDLLVDGQAFVLSSRYEGFPNALLEAMACGLPVVAFDCPNGPAEAIRHDQDGLLVPAGDVAGLAGALARVMDEPETRTRLGLRAREIVGRLGPAAVLPRWTELLVTVRRRRGGA